MIPRHKASTVRCAATMRERLALVLSRRSVYCHSHGLSKKESHHTVQKGRNGFDNKKRNLAKATLAANAISITNTNANATAMMRAAMVCMSLPRFGTNSAIVAGHSHSNAPEPFGRNGNRNSCIDGIGKNRFRLYHTRPPIHTTATANRSGSNTPLSEVLRTLVRRLNEPVPLRATPKTTTTLSATATTSAPSFLATTDEEPSTAVEEHRRLAELANELVEGYAGLPPLRNFGMEHVEPESNNDAEHGSSNSCERGTMLEFLATECCPRPTTVESAVDDYRKQDSSSSSSSSSSSISIQKLRSAATPTYEGLLDFVLQQNAVTGMGLVVSLREDLMSSLRYQNQSQTQLQLQHYEEKHRLRLYRDLDSHLKSILVRWFAPGLLSHERITYDSTPAKIIEAIATKEAVHPMTSLDDLKHRLGPSKRVFALFHPCLPNKPLVFVHVALLSNGLPSSMDDIMDSNSNSNSKEQTNSPRVAAFYSISNGVKGLAGVGLGEYLLKESIRALKEELPCLQTFVTLSPIPKFRKWIRVAFLKEEQRHQQRRQKDKDKSDDIFGEEEESSSSSSSLLSQRDREALQKCGLVSSASPFPWKEFLDTLEELDVSELMKDAKTTTDRDIYGLLLNKAEAGSGDTDTDKTFSGEDQTLQHRKQYFVLRSVLLKLASRYLGMEKHRGKPLDKVCGFHVGNGAELHDLHFGADLSRGGRTSSYGLMANYLYDTHKIANHQANFQNGYVVPVGPSVRRWLEEERPAD